MSLSGRGECPEPLWRPKGRPGAVGHLSRRGFRALRREPFGGHAQPDRGCSADRILDRRATQLRHTAMGSLAYPSRGIRRCPHTEPETWRMIFARRIGAPLVVTGLRSREQQIAGHRSAVTTMDVYAHHYEDDLHSSARAVNQLLTAS